MAFALFPGVGVQSPELQRICFSIPEAAHPLPSSFQVFNDELLSLFIVFGLVLLVLGNLDAQQFPSLPTHSSPSTSFLRSLLGLPTNPSLLTMVGALMPSQPLPSPRTASIPSPPFELYPQCQPFCTGWGGGLTPGGLNLPVESLPKSTSSLFFCRIPETQHPFFGWSPGFQPCPPALDYTVPISWPKRQFKYKLNPCYGLVGSGRPCMQWFRLLLLLESSFTAGETKEQYGAKGCMDNYRAHF